ICGTRPPASETKGPKQQYELRVKRLDIEFDKRVAELYEGARSAKLWRGVPAGRDRIEYWAAGVEAYFDAAGAGFPPPDPERPTRAATPPPPPPEEKRSAQKKHLTGRTEK